MNDPIEYSGDYSRTEPLRLTVPEASSGRRLDQVLAELLPQHSRNRLQGWVKEGCVQVDGSAETEPKRKVLGGETLLISEPEDVRNQIDQPEDIPLDVVFEDETLLVINKPAGLVVHPGSGNWSGTLMNALLHHVPGIDQLPRAGIVHRLDKDTSGLLVVAKTDPAHEALSKQFAAHSIDRRYVAVAAGRPKTGSGTVDAALARSSADRKKVAIVDEDRGKRAVTHWTLTESLKRDAALIECRLETGRTHQVRVHMASIGHPLIGDPVYGRSRHVHREICQRLDFRRQALHAAVLGFRHPVSGETLTFQSPIPSDIQQLLSALRA